MHDGIAEDKMKIKIPPKRGVTTPLRSKPSHVTLKANEKRPHSLLCRIRKYASAPWSFDVDDALAGTPSLSGRSFHLRRQNERAP
ncbi:hypothetical protein AVEN_138156-1 [Araneus ventricosus]|uniref:Uncharacterized protein n=1 Tax=Araneus ventricosus TaxID=182803 RepID=A0A4Y2LZ60_ARAVE|nr:hypothetical protein AVEN_138156-1 [Araneus ventricosus]